MVRANYTDAVGGGLLIAVGAGVAWYASANYRLGTLTEMGPGMFPAGLGVILAGFGAALVLTSIGKELVRPHIRLYSPLFVLIAIIAFGALVEPFGLIPAVVAVVVVSSLAELEVRLVRTALLAGFLAVLSYLVFEMGIGLRLTMFAWPF